MSGTEIVIGLVILVGLFGVVVPVLPGSLLILGAALVWATEDGSGTAWAAFAVVAVFLVTGWVTQFLVPGRRLKSTGVTNRSIGLGGVLGIVGFFVIPVVGLFAGFVLGIYLAEHRRVGARLAWPSTRAALTAVGLSILIELAAALLATTTWVVGAILT